MSAGLRVAFLWHMHQPYYRDLVTGRSSLPWTRLHAVKDYRSMGAIIERHPGMKATINFVPSLIRQILEYTEDGLRDAFWEATEKRAADLASADRLFILRNFFMVNWNLAVRPHRRYAQLLERRGYAPAEKDLERAATLYSAQDFLDLQVWFNLVWFHPMDVEEDRALAAMVGRGRNFTEEDKAYVLSKQLEIMRDVVPLHRRLQESGRVELSTSPFYHPILPLLVSSESALEAMPGAALPVPPFARPEDASVQLERAVAFHEKVFGRRPEGLWPSEGSVSEEIITMVMDRGFKWMASDEDILYRSKGLAPELRPRSDEHRCALLYRPWLLDRGGRTLAMVFRDHFLSDAVSFTYGHWEPEAAAADLLGRLEAAAARCPRGGEGALATIILDGENPWEYYREQGYPFLRALYRGLERSRSLRPVSLGEAVRETAPRENLPRLFAGSWINSNFQIWIGHDEDRRAWELLGRARRFLDSWEPADDPESRARAMEEILIAEGSDWCWWYGEENESGNDEAFDELYRRHLMNVFTLAGKEVPDEFKITIFTGRRTSLPVARVYSFINPSVDGRVTNYFEWLAAAEYPVDHRGSTMHRADFVLSSVYYGFNLTTMFLRLDPARGMTADDLAKFVFNVHFLKPRRLRVEVTPGGPGAPEAAVAVVGESGEAIEASGLKAAMREVLELAVPFEQLRAGVGEQVEFFISIAHDGQEMGHWPHQGYLSLTVPAEDFEEKIWSI